MSLQPYHADGCHRVDEIPAAAAPAPQDACEGAAAALGVGALRRSVAEAHRVSQASARTVAPRPVVNTIFIEPAARHICRGGPLCNSNGAAGTDMSVTEGSLGKATGGASPAANVKRRITGKRKLVQAGNAELHDESGGPASRVRRDAGGMHDAPAGAIGGDCQGSLEHAVEGPDMTQAILLHGEAHDSPICWTSTDARSGCNIANVADEPPKVDVAYGEMNTQKCTSSSTAAGSTGDSSSSSAGGAGAG